MRGGLNMGITLEKIELVKDRTGVTYKEAKEALEQADGNVVDAIVAIEENIDDMTSTKKIGARGSALMDKVKEIVKCGNITKIVVKHDGDVVLNLPLNAGILGVVIAPWGVLLGVLAAFGFRCTIDLVKDDGSVISLSDKAEEIAAGAVEAGSKAAKTVKEKAPEVVESVTSNVSEMVEKVKGSAPEDEPYVDEDDFDEEWFRDDQPQEESGQEKETDGAETETEDAPDGDAPEDDTENAGPADSGNTEE